MLTVTFHISCDNVSKKVTCNKAQTINQLTQVALEKFKIEGQNGELFHNGKKLDSSLPIRLTNLLNNSKLVLMVSRGSKEQVVNIKLAVNARGEVKSYILKSSNAQTLKQILSEFEQTHGCGLQDGGDFELAVLNSKIGSNSEEIDASLRSIVGDVSSLVIRLTFILATNNTREQDLINERQQQNMRNYQKQERERRQEEQRVAEQRAEEAASTPVINRTPEAITSAPSGGASAGATVADIQETQTIAPSHEGNTKGVSGGFQDQNLVKNTSTHTDTLYAPSKFDTYENPDDDYEMTVHQAQKYHQMIINSSRKPSAPKPRSKPSRYSIRIKFPDRLMLQLEIDDANAKVGHLVRKIDHYLVSGFQSSYNLKIGYPPFSTIPLSLADNSTALSESPFFQDEKVVLIWEPLPPHASGPYIQDSETHHAKGISDLPQIQLESNRSTLPVESRTLDSHSHTGTPTPPNTHTGTHAGAHGGDPDTRSSNLPKWFRPSK